MNARYHRNRSGDKVEQLGETNPTKSLMESQKSKIQTLEEATQCLKQGLESFNRATILECIQTLEDLTKKVYPAGAPKSTNEEDDGSVSPKQQFRCEKRSNGCHLARSYWQLPKHFQNPH